MDSPGQGSWFTISWIYESTNQIQRMVVACQLLT
jgi:hypothetical protein